MKSKQIMIAAMAQLEREKTVSIPQLAAMLGASEQDVFDALETLVFAYDAASMRLDLHESYATLETYGKDRILRLTRAETDALLDALVAAGFSDEDDLVQALVRTKSMLHEDSDGSSSKARLRVIAHKPRASIAETVAAACDDVDHHLLEISYQGVDDVSPRARCVEPLRILSIEGHRYLQAYCLDAEDWRTFRLDRILQARQLGETFEPHREAPLASPRSTDAYVQARVAFEPGCPIPVWNGLKIVETEADGSYVGTIGWTTSQWLPRHVVALMGKAKPMDPPALVVACEDYANQLLHAADMQDHASE